MTLTWKHLDLLVAVAVGVLAGLLLGHVLTGTPLLPPPPTIVTVPVPRPDPTGEDQ